MRGRACPLVIWATQVLETLAQEGIPSRAEITDAAMGERAKCVMLNKGPYVVSTVRVLDDILRRMQANQARGVHAAEVALARPVPPVEPVAAADRDCLTASARCEGRAGGPGG